MIIIIVIIIIITMLYIYIYIERERETVQHLAEVGGHGAPQEAAVVLAPPQVVEHLATIQLLAVSPI